MSLRRMGAPSLRSVGIAYWLLPRRSRSRQCLSTGLSVLGRRKGRYGVLRGPNTRRGARSALLQVPLGLEAGCEDFCEREVDELELRGGRVYLHLGARRDEPPRR